MGYRISSWRVVLAVADAAIVVLVLLIATVTHYAGQMPPPVWNTLQLAACLGAVLLVLTNIAFGLYNRVWQYATADAALATSLSVTASQVVAAVIARQLTGGLPVSVWLTTWLGTLLGIGGVRFLWRYYRPLLDGREHAAAGATKRVLIYGAGGHGNMLVRQMSGRNNGHYQVVGFVDDDPAKQGLIVGRQRVLGTSEDLPHLVHEHAVDEVVIAMPSATRGQIRRAYELCREAGVAVKVLPSLLELMEDPSVQRVHPINVDDLLGRELALADIRLYEDYFAGKTVLVTGAGGSIGSELSRQICRYGPQRLILLGRGENRIHWIHLYLRQRHPEIEVIPIVANVAVTTSVERLLRRYRPAIVIHAAAHKHVYLMEYVPVEAARNNVLATARLAELAEQYGVERFVFISTDKAASPVNVMGATKRMGELLLTARPPKGTHFICVRFGNVLGSEGSVLEIFKRQWQRGEPLTVTHADATRYFMSIPEACFLVLQAGAMGRHGDIFVLGMGEPMRILDLAREFIMLQRGDPDVPGAITITGLRPGERVHETLTNPDEEILTTESEHIGRISPNGTVPAWGRMTALLDELATAVRAEDDEAVCRVLSEATQAELAGGCRPV